MAQVSILMGSKSDLPVMQEAIDQLIAYARDCEARGVQRLRAFRARRAAEATEDLGSG